MFSNVKQAPQTGFLGLCVTGFDLERDLRVIGLLCLETYPRVRDTSGTPFSRNCWLT